MITFDIAKDCILNGKYFDINDIDFDMNTIGNETEFCFYESNPYEGKFAILQEKYLEQTAINKIGNSDEL